MLLLFGLASVCQKVQGADSRNPNILFLAVDDLRPELGCYGQRKIVSPNIDAMAAAGTLFENNYCQAAHCCPSRASLMTGLRPDAAGVDTDKDPYFRDTVPDVVTLPQYFAKCGYRTIKVGKIFHNNQDPQSWQTILNEWGQPDVSLYNDPVSKAKFKDALKKIEEMVAQGKHLESWERVRMMLSTSSESVDVPDNAYPDGAITDLAIQSLEKMKADGQPMFLAVGWYKPHLPFNCPKKYWDLYDPDSIQLAPNPFPPKDVPPEAMHNWEELRAYADIPREGPLSDEQARRLMHGYYACVSFADTQVGKVLHKLDELGLSENTIVVLWGDHGWHLGDHGLWCKQSNFETATHAPLIIRVPGFSGGQRVESLTEFVDMYPTLCDLAGLPVPKGLAGQSLVPLLKNPAYQPWKDVALSQYPRGEFVGRSMRTERYRFTVWEHRATHQIDAVELYDHATDPQENVNIAGSPENAELVKTLMEQYRRAWGNIPTNSTPTGKVIHFTAEEGYKNGDLRNNADFGWSGSAGAFFVDAANGVVTNLGAQAYKTMVCNRSGMSPDDRIYSVKGTFSFARNIPGELDKPRRVVSVDFRDGPQSNAQCIRMELRRLPDERYDISLLETSGTTTFVHAAASVEESELGYAASPVLPELGVDAANNLSGLLELTFQLKRGADEKSWLATGILSQAATGKELVRLPDVLFATDTSFFTNAIYAGFSALEANANTRLSDMALHEMEFSSSSNPD